MKLRKKIIAVFLLGVFVQNIFWPTLSLALTSGPSAPQSASFEEYNATDMVNLLTGDMVYNLSLFEVPSPDGEAFPVNLFYHGGIQLNQEASDYGLGWGINTGSINRRVNGYPDDYLREYKFNSSSYSSGPGEPASFQADYGSGVEYSGDNFSVGVNMGPLEATLNASIGKSGENASSRFSFDGISIGASLGAFSKAGSSSSALSALLDNVSLGISSYDAGEVTYSAELGPLGISLTDKGGGDVSVNGTDLDAGGAGVPGKASTAGDWTTISKTGPSNSIPIGHLPGVHHIIRWQNYYFRQYLDKVSLMEPYGSLYLGKHQSSPAWTHPSSGGSLNYPAITGAYSNSFSLSNGLTPTTAMDVAQDVAEGDEEVGVHHIAYDLYQVLAPGISGRIKPDVFENVSLCGINSNTAGYEVKYHKQGSFSSTPLDEGFDSFISPSAWNTDYQNGHTKLSNVKFRYEYEFASNLNMNDGYVAIASPTNASSPGVSSPQSDFFTAPADDPSKGYENKYLKGKRMVEWFTDYELRLGLGRFSSSMTSTGYDKSLVVMNAVKYLPDVTAIANGSSFASPAFHDEFLNYSHQPNPNYLEDEPYEYDLKFANFNKNIAFKITAEDGMVYHFGLPVYSRNEIQFYSSGGTNITKGNASPYAYTWLLTAITGPDYIDINENGKTDDEDYGYWISYDYGKWTNNYVWRTPYETNHYERDYDNNIAYAMIGEKQLYYLNKISTRGHTAVFIHSVREDGKGANIDFLSHGNAKAKQLKTDEIRLFSNKDLKNLEDNYDFLPNLGNGSLPKHFYELVYTTDDVYGNPATDKIKELSLKTVKFSYDYSLCKNTLNSDDATTNSGGTSKGKLTLKKVEILGKREVKVFPPYEFGYNETSLTDNPNYSKDKYDRWGFYKSDYGDGGQENRYVTDVSKDNVDAWSLRTVKTPLDATVSFDYESDTYSRIGGTKFNDETLPRDFNGQFKYERGIDFDYIGGCAEDVNTFEIYHDALKEELYNLDLSNGSVALNVTNTVCTNVSPTQGCCLTYDTPSGVTSETAAVLSYDQNDNIVTLNLSNVDNLDLDDPNQVIGKMPIESIVVNKLTIHVPDISYGGGIRVKEIAVDDGNGNIYKSAYNYSYDANRSSGFTIIEPPAYDRKLPTFINYEVNNTQVSFDGPSAGVLYSKVKSTAYSNHTTEAINKALYEFEAYDKARHFVRAKDNPNSECYRYITHNRLNQVGRLLSVKNLDKDDNVISESDYNYIESVRYSGIPEKNQGIVNRVSHTIRKGWQWVSAYIGGGWTVDTDWEAVVNDHTTYPNVLKSVTNKRKNITSNTTYEEFDYLTGLYNTVINKRDNQGTSYYKQTKEVVIPAHTKYIELGSKVDDKTNKNMLTQSAGSNTYVLNNYNGEWKLISANVQTWNKDWNNYRTYNTSQSGFIDDNTLPDVWRKHQNYVWKSLVNPDGTIPSTGTEAFEDYNFASSSNDPHWLKTSEVLRYDMYSHPIESRGVNDNGNSEDYSAVKLGYENTRVVASVAGSNFTGFAYSGAEDEAVGTSNYYQSEVEGVDSRVSVGTGFAHTGNFVCKLGTTTDFGFRYGGSIGTSSSNYFKSGKRYRASVWLRHNNKEFGILYCHLYDGSNQDVAWVGTGYQATTSKKFGNWYLLTLDIDLSDSQFAGAAKMVFGVHSDDDNTANLPVYFDDFRVHPADAVMTSYVYDNTGMVSAILDNENIGTKYFYDAAGRLVNTYRETESGFVKTSQNAYHYKRPFN